MKTEIKHMGWFQYKPVLYPDTKILMPGSGSLYFQFKPNIHVKFKLKKLYYKSYKKNCVIKVIV